MADDTPADLLPNWDFAGRCYDVLRVDPLAIPQGATYQMAFLFDKWDSIGDNSASKPAATLHVPDPGGSYDAKVTEISSSYDYRTFLSADGSVTVSDPAGAAFSASLSASAQQTRNDTASRSSVITYTSEKVLLYGLRLQPDYPDLALAGPLAAALQALPAASGGDGYQKFFADFGTHYASQVYYGGRATQRVTVTRSDYETFLEQAVSLKTEVSATFEIAKAGGSISGEDKRSSKFTSASGVTVEQITYSGGPYPQKMFDMWAMMVKDLPAAIEVELHPLYELLTPRWCGDSPDLGTRQQLLREATDAYLATQGTDTSAAVLTHADPLCLTLVTPGPARYLSGGKTPWAATVPEGAGQLAATPAELTWTLVDPLAVTAHDTLRAGQAIALKTSDGRFLDAQQGADGTYDRGDGLTAATATSPAADSAQWTLELVNSPGRAELVAGDYVRLRSHWRDADGDCGYLLGETDPHEIQRVYAFGDARQPGTLWHLTTP